jgi:phosphoribosylformimino-5-aminoimidazole carboxamide ribotide isomerase
MAVRDYPEFQSLKSLAGQKDRVIVSVDSKDKVVAVRGWTQKSQLSPSEMMQACCEHVWGFLYTDVDVEGKMEGINRQAVEEVVSATDLPVIVSGGITTGDDIRACESAGAWGIVLGKALYEGKINLEEVVG